MIDILDIFYNSIIKEATIGRIDCSIPFNMPFSTYIYEANELYECINSDKEILIPTLIIQNKNDFDNLIKEYVTLALEFYEENNFPEEILNYKLYEETKKICKEKMILTLLWSNATSDDFKNPNQYLRKRIEFLKNYYETYHQLGYCESLKGNIELKVTKDSIMNETPTQLEISLINDLGEKYIFPQIKFGIYNEEAFIYAVQNRKSENNAYTKQINRILYKIGEGFDSKVDNFETYEEGNLKDVTSSFVVALNICLFYLNSLGIENISVPAVLIERWNAKSMALKLKAKIFNYSQEKINEEINNQEKIWTNLNEKFIRSFRRLEHHHESLNITSEPFLVDSFLHIHINNYISCNNELLRETAHLARKPENGKKLS